MTASKATTSASFSKMLVGVSTGEADSHPRERLYVF